MKPQEIIKSYPVAIVATCAIIICAGLGYWRASTAADVQAVLITREQESQRLSDNVRNGARLDAQIEQLSALVGKVGDRLSNPADLASNQQYFYKLENDSGVKLLDLHQAAAPARNAKKKASYTFYSVVSYTLKVQGDYVGVLKFLRAVESGSRLTVYNTASLDVVTDKKAEELGVASPLALTISVDLLGTL